MKKRTIYLDNEKNGTDRVAIESDDQGIWAVVNGTETIVGRIDEAEVYLDGFFGKDLCKAIVCNFYHDYMTQYIMWCTIKIKTSAEKVARHIVYRAIERPKGKRSGSEKSTKWLTTSCKV
jgi:hypothetical protein